MDKMTILCGQQDHRDFDLGEIRVVDVQPETENINITPTTESQQILPSKNKYIKEVNVEPVTAGIDDNIQPYNIRKGITILGVNGNLEPDKPNQIKTITPEEYEQRVIGDEGYELAEVTVEAIPKNYVGSAINQLEAQTYTPTTTDQEIASGQYLRGTQIIKGDANLVAENIAKDVEIFGIVGTHEGGGTGDVTLNIVGVWTLGEGVGIYYRFNEDGTLEALQNGEVVMSGTYTIEGTTINTTINGETSPLYYNTSDNGIGSEEGVSFMWRLTPSGSIEINSNGDYDVAHYIQAIVNVPAPENEIELVEYTITQDTDLSGGNVEFLPKYDNIIDEDLDLSTLPLDDCGQTYGFEYSTSTNRIEPLNKKKVSSFAYCKIRFTMKSDGGSLAVTIYQSSEVNYDYGFISKLDTDLNKNADGSDVNSVYNSKGLQGNYTYTFTDIPAGEHFFTFKYRKDTSNDTGEDTCAITNIHINDIDKLEADGFSKVTLEKPTDLESDNILSGKTVFGVEGNLVIADYQSTTATPQDVLLGKKFLSEEGVIIEGSVEEFVPASEYKTNVVLNTKGKIVSENITINVTAEGARDAKETMYEMQEADYMRFLQGTIGLYDIPTDAEYLEQQEYVNTTINNLMGEEF